MLKVYFENEHICLRYDEELQLGIGQWKGFVSSNELRAMALHTLEFANTHGITRWLSDRRKMRAIRQQDQQWTVEEFIPKVLASPLRRVATIVSEDIFNNMAVEQMLKRSGGLGDISLRDFNNEAEAMEWLKQPLEQESSMETGASSAD
ncbi:STAS/SEC14 domain-containing protein [Pontibacter pamirensis]|uniref:STAS/SEC14 domain-containing protein n=1 Tax=Pontibacter pamirensis TaxID=2562824 RepID=UPI0013893C35|nr:STAS/SEC14 domain-containing protein [Pontibacter pamirensis]